MKNKATTKIISTGLDSKINKSNGEEKGARHLKFKNAGESQKNKPARKITKISNGPRPKGNVAKNRIKGVDKTTSRINKEINKLAHDLDEKNHKNSINKKKVYQSKLRKPNRSPKKTNMEKPNYNQKNLPKSKKLKKELNLLPKNHKKSSKSKVASSENNDYSEIEFVNARGVNQLEQTDPRNRFRSSIKKHKLKKDNICALPHTDGPVTCMGAKSRWFFDSSKGKCVTFVYGGCHGTENNFRTKAECEAVCPSNQALLE